MAVPLWAFSESNLPMGAIAPMIHPQEDPNNNVNNENDGGRRVLQAVLSVQFPSESNDQENDNGKPEGSGSGGGKGNSQQQRGGGFADSDDSDEEDEEEEQRKKEEKGKQKEKEKVSETNLVNQEKSTSSQSISGTSGAAASEIIASSSSSSNIPSENGNNVNQPNPATNSTQETTPAVSNNSTNNNLANDNSTNNTASNNNNTNSTNGSTENVANGNNPAPAANPRPTPSNAITLEDLLNKPIPIGKRVLCRVVRQRGVNLYPVYEMFLEGSAGKMIFLLTAKKSVNSRTSTYRISSKKGDFSITEKGYRAKLRSNFSGTLFSAFSKGVNPHKFPKTRENTWRKELVSVLYESNVIGFNGPRKMTILMPGLTEKADHMPWIPKSEEEGLFPQFQKQNRNVTVLQNKTPQWSEESQSFVLNFGGRVTFASVKNFQVISEKDPDYIAMQFGRIGEDLFTLDFQFPFSAIQAFAVALSSFDSKLACE